MTRKSRLIRQPPATARMTGAELVAARLALGLTAADLGRILLIEQRDPGESVRRWETSGVLVPGPVTVAIRLMLQLKKAHRTPAATPPASPPEALAPPAPVPEPTTEPEAPEPAKWTTPGVKRRRA